MLLRIGAVAMAIACLAAQHRIAAIAGEAVVIFDARDVTLINASDGTVLVRAANKPIYTPTGAPVGTGSVTGLTAGAASVGSGPDFLAIFVTLDVGAQRIYLTDVRSRPSGPAFHRTTTYVPSLGATGPGGLIVEPNGSIAIRAAIDTEQPAPLQVLNLADDFTQPRVIGVVGDTNRAYRNRSNSNLIPQAGVKQPIGHTFSFSTANANQTFSMSHISTPIGGAIVTCEPSQGCWWRGYQQFNDLRGTASSFNPSTLGVSADTGARLNVTRAATGTQPGERACPPGPPPAPTGVFAVARTEGRYRAGAVISWDSSCADSYQVVVTDANNRRFTFVTQEPRLTIQDFDATDATYEIKAINAAGASIPTDGFFLLVF